MLKCEEGLPCWESYILIYSELPPFQCFYKPNGMENMPYWLKL